VKATVRNTNEVLPVAAPMKFNRLPEPVFISVPLKLGNSIGCSTYNTLSSQEKKGLTDATKAIYQTYKTTIEAIEKNSNYK
jgi:malate/lactate dehydrogenase